MRITKATEVGKQRRQWLIEPYLLFSAVTLITGARRAGKGLFCNLVAALASRGRRPPWDLAGGEAPLPATNIFWATPEVSEDLSSEVVARFEAAGGDVDRLHLVALSRNDSIADLKQRLTGSRPKLLIVDPLQAVLGDLGSPAARSKMEDLIGLARDANTAVLAIRHLTKTGLGRGRGEIADVVRSQLYVGKHPADQELCVVIQGPSSYGEGEPLAFRINHLESGGTALGYVEEEWDDDLSYADLIPRPPQRRPTSPRAPAKERATKFLLGLLADGPVAREEVLEAARRRRFSERTVERAAVEVGVQRESQRTEGQFASALWSLPVEAEPEWQTAEDSQSTGTARVKEVAPAATPDDSPSEPDAKPPPPDLIVRVITPEKPGNLEVAS